MQERHPDEHQQSTCCTTNAHAPLSFTSPAMAYTSQACSLLVNATHTCDSGCFASRVKHWSERDSRPHQPYNKSVKRHALMCLPLHPLQLQAHSTARATAASIESSRCRIRTYVESCRQQSLPTAAATTTTTTTSQPAPRNPPDESYMLSTHPN